MINLFFKKSLQMCCDNILSMGGSRVGGDRGSVPPGNSQVAIGFLKNTGKDPLREAIGPYGPL